MATAVVRLVRTVAVALAVSAVSTCGPGDSEQTECRCVEDTDLEAFPECRGMELTERRDPSNPFATRTPDCPSGKLLFLREPLRPENVLLNVRDTFEGFSPVQYMDQVTEDFLFVPDADDLQRFPEAFNPPEDYNPESNSDTLWTRDDERRFASNLLDRTRFHRIEFSRWYEAGRDQQITTSDPLVET
ncbi:uncharacterized protein METZ01_LOCUS232689, partial [marine metagenome]